MRSSVMKRKPVWQVGYRRAGPWGIKSRQRDWRMLSYVKLCVYIYYTYFFISGNRFPSNTSVSVVSVLIFRHTSKVTFPPNKKSIKSVIVSKSHSMSTASPSKLWTLSASLKPRRKASAEVILETPEKYIMNVLSCTNYLCTEKYVCIYIYIHTCIVWVSTICTHPTYTVYTCISFTYHRHDVYMYMLHIVTYIS